MNPKLSEIKNSKAFTSKCFIHESRPRKENKPFFLFFIYNYAIKLNGTKMCHEIDLFFFKRNVPMWLWMFWGERGELHMLKQNSPDPCYSCTFLALQRHFSL